MPRSRESYKIRPWDIIRPIMKFLLDPLWYSVEWMFLYTHIVSFPLAHQAFWHSFLIPIVVFPTVFRTNYDNSEVGLTQYIWLPFCFIGYIASLNVPNFIDSLKPKVQGMTHIIVGLLGMVASIWGMLVCIILYQQEYHRDIFGCLFFLAVVFLSIFYITFLNCRTNLYIDLPSENKPFSGIKLYAVIFGLFHLVVAIATFWVTKTWSVSCLLIASSFDFCVDAWSCFFTESYMLCEHREFKYEMNRDNGIRYHVAVRRVYEKLKNPKTLPDGFQFDDELQVDQKWLSKV